MDALIEARQPGVVLVPHSIDSFGYAAALAAKERLRLSRPMCSSFEYQGDELVATRGGYGQKVNVEVDFPGQDTVVLRASQQCVQAAGRHARRQRCRASPAPPVTVARDAAANSSSCRRATMST